MSAIPEPREPSAEGPLRQLDHIAELPLAERAQAFEEIHDHLAQRLRETEN
ncbi:hypothetical protein [Bogoriella caseilytica]|uniref:hypothetical protein n=1 Tax=Bogoriella caseilytica TaxID=56055 RepID=UPI0014741AB4|nr:hypothetical protein [Bogoriella caseilytica]